MKRVLFLGEDSLTGAGRYLAGALKWAGLSFDYQPDQRPIPAAWLTRSYSAVICSDYRYASWTAKSRRWLSDRVQNGMGFLMIGGWASFTGLVGGYRGTDIEEMLPVFCQAGDDRVNRSAILLAGANSPIVCGYHRATPKPGARVELEFQDLRVTNSDVILGARHPAFVTSAFGLGRTAAFLTDVAPHWAGGLVDWGRHVPVRPAPHTTLHVGTRYLLFLKRLLGQ